MVMKAGLLVLAGVMALAAAMTASASRNRASFDQTSLIGLSVRGTITSTPHPITTPFCVSAPLAIDSSNGPFSIEMLSPSKSGVVLSQPGDQYYYQHGLGMLTADGQLTRIALIFEIKTPAGEAVPAGISIGDCSGPPIAAATAFTKVVTDGVCLTATYTRADDTWTITGTFSACGSATPPSATPPAPKPTPPPLPPATCLPYIVIDSRGSGAQYATSPPAARFVAELKRLKGDAKVGLIRNPYPARGWTSFFGAVLQLPAGYHKSVDAGEQWLKDELAKEMKTCATSKTRFFLTGYSQGAQVVGDVYQRAWYPAVAGVALFGDPYFNQRDGYVVRGDYDHGLSGNLGTRPIFDKIRRTHVLSFCHRHDPVCQGPLSYAELVRYRFSRHTSYDASGEPERAAQYFANLD
jgi:predicted esterase